MTIHSSAGSQIKAKEQYGVRFEPRAKSLWKGERFQDLVAALASVALLGGAYAVMTQVVLPRLAQGFAVL